MLALLLWGCGSSPPPPKPKPPPAPEEPEPKRPEPVTLKLQRSAAIERVASRGRPWSAVSGTPDLVKHPEGEKLAAYVVTPFGDDFMAVAFDAGAKGVWTVSADINADRQVRAPEFVDLNAETPTAILSTVMKRGRPIADLPISLEVGTAEVDGETVFTHKIEGARTAEIPCEDCDPAGPIAARVDTWGGVFDNPRVRLTIDGDGDGLVDVGNLLSTFTVEQGKVAARGKVWSFAIDGDGNGMTLNPLPDDTAIPGLRAGSAAPDFTVTTHDGEEQALAALKGKRVLVDFGSHACVDCGAAAGELPELAKTHDLTLIGVSFDTEAAKDKRGRDIAPAWPTAWMGPANAVATSYGVHRGPVHALIDAEGNLEALGSLAMVKKALD